MIQHVPDLPALLSYSKWHTIQRHFSEVLGITLLVVNPSGEIVTEISKPSWLPEDAFRVCVFSIEQTMLLLKRTSLAVRQNNWKEAIQCPLGFYSYLIPLQVGEKTIGYILAGPVVVVSRPDPQNYTSVSAELSQRGISRELFIETAGMLKIFSYTSIQSTIELLFDIASSIMEPYQVRSSTPDIPLEKPVSPRQQYQMQKEKVMSALLDVVAGFMNAERGSVFLYDEDHKELYLGASKGITEEIARNTRVRLGERIIGMVAVQRQAMVLKEDVSDPQVRALCHIPEIKCAVIVPVQVRKKLVGVLTVATFQTAKARFFDNNMPVINNFVKLAETTLQNLSKNHSS